MSQLARDNNVYFEFYPHSCFIKDQTTQEVLLKGVLKDGLYSSNLHSVKPFSQPFQSSSSQEVHFSPPTVLATSVSKNKNSVFNVWHYRLGHVAIVQKVLAHCNLNVDANENLVLCSSC